MCEGSFSGPEVVRNTAEELALLVQQPQVHHSNTSPIINRREGRTRDTAGKQER